MNSPGNWLRLQKPGKPGLFANRDLDHPAAVVVSGYEVLQCLLLLVLLVFASSSVRADNDLRVLIDVSGSMKQNDPANLRQPALKLLIGLLPEGTRTAGWLFAEDTASLLSPATVDSAWKKQAEQRVTRIHSRGQFTHIEKALSTAMTGWEEASGDEQRSIILLTDGMVDVSKNEADSTASRQRILQELLPRLQQNKITVNAIALSENADQDLMRQLAVGTDGWYEMATDANALQRLFLHMFEKSTDVETLPLEDNRFQVDNSIDEMTLLVFRQADAEDTRIVMPDGSEITASTAADKVNWRQESGYDLITIPDPAGGEWRINAEIDPDNRVMVVTDLKMKVTTLPNHILAGEQFDYQMELLARETRITREDFLSFVSASLEQEDEHGDSRSFSMERDEEAVYSLSLQDQLSPGTYTLTAVADSQTFQRRKSQSVEVHKSPMKTALVTSGDDSQAIYTVTVSALPELVEPESIELQAELSGPGSERSAVEFQTGENSERILVLDSLAPGAYQLQMTIKGQTPRGRAFVARPKALNFGSAPAQSETEAVAEQSQDEPEPETEAAVSEDEPSESDAEMAEEEEPVDWLYIGLVVGGVNLLLILLGGAGYLFWRKRRNAPGPEEEL